MWQRACVSVRMTTAQMTAYLRAYARVWLFGSDERVAVLLAEWDRGDGRRHSGVRVHCVDAAGTIVLFCLFLQPASF